MKILLMVGRKWKKKGKESFEIMVYSVEEVVFCIKFLKVPCDLENIKGQMWENFDQNSCFVVRTDAHDF